MTACKSTRRSLFEMTFRPKARPEPCKHCTCKRCNDLKRDMASAAIERDEVKRSMEMLDPPSKFWRDLARTSIAGDMQVKARLDVLERRDDQVRAAKKQLWELWSGLEVDSPIRESLQSIWSSF